jgi:hypothetical protein
MTTKRTKRKTASKAEALHADRQARLQAFAAYIERGKRRFGCDLVGVFESIGPQARTDVRIVLVR